MPINQDVFYMQQALELAKHAESCDEVPVGAVIIFNNEIISSGYNCPISTNDPTAHAEIIAMRNAAKKINNYRLVETTLYVTLEPCIMCIGAMIHARIKRLVFGALDPKTGATKTINHRIECQGEIMAKECGEILSAFFKSKRKQS